MDTIYIRKIIFQFCKKNYIYKKDIYLYDYKFNNVPIKTLLFQDFSSAKIVKKSY